MSDREFHSHYKELTEDLRLQPYKDFGWTSTKTTTQSEKRGKWLSYYCKYQMLIMLYSHNSTALSESIFSIAPSFATFALVWLMRC